MQLISEQRKEQTSRIFYNQLEAQSAEIRTTFTSTYVSGDKPWLLPSIEDNMTYHLEWKQKDISSDVHTIDRIMNGTRLSCEIAAVKQGATLTQYLLKPTEKTKWGFCRFAGSRTI